MTENANDKSESNFLQSFYICSPNFSIASQTDLYCSKLSWTQWLLGRVLSSRVL